MDLQQELLLVTKALDSAQVPWALCGAMAVAIHGYPRMTRDLDLLVEERQAEAALKAAATVGFTLEGGLLVLDQDKPTQTKLLRVTKVSGPDFLVLDLLLVDDGFLRPIWEGCETHEIGSRMVRVISRSGLGIMKRAAGRPSDLRDLEQLGIPLQAP